MIDNSHFDAIFKDSPIMAILRRVGAERGVRLATTAWDLGIDVVEITIQGDDDLDTLREVCAAGRERGKTVGAGTVVSVEQVTAAAGAGAGFIVSPGLDRNVVRASVEAGLPPMPGVATATEVQMALRDGLTWLKAFPASVLGACWIKAMHGPFPRAVFAATGGMDSSNAETFLNAGARVVAVGSALEDEAQLSRLADLLQ
jgi:Entner-Doudoroff aldolase